MKSRHAGLILRYHHGHDLELLARQLVKAVPVLPIEQAVEPMMSLEEVSKRFNVSTKSNAR